MSEETGSVPALSGGDASAPSTPAETSSQSSVSAPAGSAPGGGVDAGTAGEATGTPAAQSAAQFAFLKRKFNDQKHAEEVLGSEIGMTRGLQRQNAELTKRLSTMEAELNALRPLVVERQTPRGQGQGVREGASAPGASQSFAKELAESGELELIAKIAADPEMGMGHAMYRMAELLDQRNSKQLEQLRGEVTGTLEEREARQKQQVAVARGLTAAKSLVTDYPELDNDNQSDEAIEAQQAILDIITNLPQGPQWLATDPTECLRYAAERYRRTHGTPIFAQPPGTSGSPSVRAAQAAEAAGAVAATIEGSGVPRQRPNGQPETPAERIKRENREISGRTATTPKGRPLGFEIGA